MRLALLGLAAALALGGPAAARPHPRHAPTPAAAVDAPDAYYTNVSGHRVHRPERSAVRPVGATARCRDGTWSFSEHHRGTCSHHGGVAAWL